MLFIVPIKEWIIIPSFLIVPHLTWDGTEQFHIVHLHCTHHSSGALISVSCHLILTHHRVAVLAAYLEGVVGVPLIGLPALRSSWMPHHWVGGQRIAQ